MDEKINDNPMPLPVVSKIEPQEDFRVTEVCFGTQIKFGLINWDVTALPILTFDDPRHGARVYAFTPEMLNNLRTWINQILPSGGHA